MEKSNISFLINFAEKSFLAKWYKNYEIISNFFLTQNISKEIVNNFFEFISCLIIDGNVEESVILNPATEYYFSALKTDVTFPKIELSKAENELFEILIKKSFEQIYKIDNCLALRKVKLALFIAYQKNKDLFKNNFDAEIETIKNNYKDKYNIKLMKLL